ncbi:MAG TPA: 3-methyl-2-oxobutanoate hydroxymethyltransferase [Nitrospiria bacterium]|nr:3-methyl-2-oxobutanoate hydroxymethyltransferase [Nitrospiria bacterium]
MSKITVPEIIKRKKEGRKITMLTAYDFPFAQILDEAGIDLILVGDSLGVVVQGKDDTLSVTMDDMLYHTRIVSRAVNRGLVIGDMPFLSFQTGIEDTIRNAGRFLQAGAGAVKMEGGKAVADRVAALTAMDIPVMGHIGLTPQSIHRMGGYKVQGRKKEMADQILTDAKAIERAGAFSLIIEGVPLDLGRRITREISIPTIGIGAGPHCDGQVLVLHDLLGLFDRFHPTFVRTFANLRGQVLDAARQYKEEVEKGKFPSDEESYK